MHAMEPACDESVGVDQAVMQNDEEMGQHVFRKFLKAFFVGVLLSCIAVSLLILFLKGLPALGDLDFVRTNCTTVKQVYIGRVSCSYSCHKLDSKCTRTLYCWRIFVHVEGSEKTQGLSLLLYDVNSESTSCSNYRDCMTRSDVFRHIDNRLCYYHPLRRGVAYLHRPPNPLPYVVIPCVVTVVVAFVVAGFLYCHCCNTYCATHLEERQAGHRRTNSDLSLERNLDLESQASTHRET